MSKVLNILDYKAKKEIEQIEIKVYEDIIHITTKYGYVNIKFCNENSDLIRNMSPWVRMYCLKNVSSIEFKSIILYHINKIVDEIEDNRLFETKLISKCENCYEKIKQIMCLYDYDRVQFEVSWSGSYTESYWYKIV